jgi:hypothetical protein
MWGKKFLFGILLLLLMSCRGEKENPLATACGEEKPPPTYTQPYNEFRSEPKTPPYKRVTYVWYCLEGSYVEESWSRTEKGCWVREGEYRRQNPGCPS